MSKEVIACFEPVVDAIVSQLDIGVLVATRKGQVLYHNAAMPKLLSLEPGLIIQNLKDLKKLKLQKLLYQALFDAGEPDAISRKSTSWVSFGHRIKAGEDLIYLEFKTGVLQIKGQKEEVRLLMVQDKSPEKRLEAVLGSGKKSGLVTDDPAMLEIVERIHQLAPTDASVLLQGESGTGKSLLARMIHDNSGRIKGRLVEVNCAAIPETLIESELFGHVKGSFTGAVDDRPGRFEMAHLGTLFLDEIAEIPLNLQAKLLKVLQEQSYEKVGSDKTRNVDVRILAASNKNLRDAVDEGSFRADLYYRLAVIPIYVPPLRERPSDIIRLSGTFLERMADRGYDEDIEFSNEARRLMMEYPWPGNIRELINAVEHGVICARAKVIEPKNLPPEVRDYTELKPVSKLEVQEDPVEADNWQHQKAEIEDALKRSRNSRALAARILGIDRSTLWRRMQKLGIQA